MSIRIRSVRDSDYQWLLELHHTVYRDLITQEFGYWDNDEELGLFKNSWESKQIEILLQNDRPVGMFIAVTHADHLWLDEIQIDPHYQNQGIGTEVIGRLIARARARHFPLRLRVLHANQRACRLYQRLGFLRIDRAEHHHLMEIK
ncbi:MAG: GNAT family N-acetyltransferase [Nitrosomonas sp.]|uniref:GNAT family N-acetyltransferase n=1 Tax=Nitrosomonas sp. TaxID=42353 RepID=UPI0025E0622A|nr:GNAT family N-acetyltransferase [Nitrosomonas sp.]MBY0475240.1 GNAT family N-acetyltransferase [Nitrosomonas sp.]